MKALELDYLMTSMDKRVIVFFFFLYLLYYIQRVIMRWTRSPLSIPSTEEWRARLVRKLDEIASPRG